jgi:hypothetical protein
LLVVDDITGIVVFVIRSMGLAEMSGGPEKGISPIVWIFGLIPFSVSADIGMAQTRDHDFFWDTLAVYGTSPPPEVVPSSDEPVFPALLPLKK